MKAKAYMTFCPTKILCICHMTSSSTWFCNHHLQRYL